MDVSCKNDPVMVGVVLNSDYFDINKTFDLCDECNEKLVRFLNGEDYLVYSEGGITPKLNADGSLYTE